MNETNGGNWNKVFSLAEELEVLDPALDGLLNQLLSIRHNHGFSKNWLDKVSRSYYKEILLYVAFELNIIAGQRFKNKEIDSAKSICQFSLGLYTEILGESHQDTRTIASNLERVEKAITPAVELPAPGLWKLSPVAISRI